ncbi:MAG: HAMP domain-containing histidine kinase [Clostridia bacterium]|nr:HAMP domain-containing histidine kinase [Clostridia bacterium]
MKRRSKANQSIVFNLLSTYLVIIILILALIWVLEVVFFDGIYRKIKSDDVQEITNQAIKLYEADDVDGLLELSVTTDCNIVVFTVDKTSVGEKYNVKYSSSRITDPNDLEQSIVYLLNQMGNRSRISIMNSSYEQDETLIVGQIAIFNEKVVYYYVSTVIAPTDFTIEVIMYLLLIITPISLTIMIVFSILFSRKISKPIRNIAEQTKQIDAGNMDVTFCNREFKEVSVLSDTLNYAIAEIERNEKIRKEVVANVSHELRTPLTMIRSYAELIRDISGENKDKREEHLDIILNETERLEYLVNDVLDFSKMYAGTIAYNFEEFDISAKLEKLEKFYKDKFSEFNFIFNYPRKIGVLGDPKRIEQVIINLINNAINYSGESRDVVVNLYRVQDSGKYRLEVIDKGVGIKEEEQKYIFDRHFRASNSKRTTTGSGIGLAIVKQILTYHGFTFGVISKENEGSTFYFEF